MSDTAGTSATAPAQALHRTASSPDERAPVLQVDGLSLHYRTRFGEVVHAVDDVSFSLAEGEVFGIAGESGCGKSTLVNGVMGLLLPPLYRTAGHVRIDGMELFGMSAPQLRRDVLGVKVSMIPQGALNSLNPSRKVRDVAVDMVRSHEPGRSRREIHERLRERFEAIGLDPRVLGAYPVELSGGMKQRVVIGISTLMNPRVVIADEPSSALDVSTQKAVIELLLDLLRRKVIGSMVFITHELPLLYHISNRIAVMYAGQIVEVGTRDQIIHDPRHPYTRALMQSMLLAEPGTRGAETIALAGAPPSLYELPAGCRFAPRCPMVHADVCPHTAQQLHSVGEREVRCQYAD
ncbi:MAG: ATP-binding cassette domain-containing protein [Chitinivibrionales bacterium]|nr:ATP-binding cassette domain-containing protein [Chitinivibrionales bacterium]